jgi:hypothetical protein
MQSAARAEHQRLERELARLLARREALAKELAELDVQSTNLGEQLVALSRFLQDAPALDGSTPRLRAVPKDAPPEGVALKGARIREAAVRVLAESPDAHAPVHYRTWYELLRREGLVPAGKDPLATFLTQIGRSPVVRRTTKAGTYELDFEFANRVRERLVELREALRDSHDLPPEADVTAIGRARTRRAELTNKVAAAERSLEEALRSLGGAA